MRVAMNGKDTLAASRLKVGAAIRAKRTGSGLSLAELAKRIGVVLSTMSKIENGKISTSFERLESISRALDADLIEILGAAAPIGLAGADRHYGMRKSITVPEAGPVVDAGSYLEWYHATDMLHKRCHPMVAEVIISDIADYGPFAQHDGEEFNYVLEGELEFHTEIYAPVRLSAGSSIYFDAEMRHAHIRVGAATCRMLAILCPRGETSGLIGPDRRLLRVEHGGNARSE